MAATQILAHRDDDTRNHMTRSLDKDDRHIPMSTVIAITIVAVVISLSVIAFCMYRQRKRRIEKLRMKALGLDDIPITAGISYQKGESTGGSGEWYRGPVEGSAEIGSDNKPKSGWAPIDMPKRPGEAHVQQIP